MNLENKESGACCPQCGGRSGYEVRMTETHEMSGEWGTTPEATTSGYDPKFSLAKCGDCGAKMRLSMAEKMR